MVPVPKPDIQTTGNINLVQNVQADDRFLSCIIILVSSLVRDRPYDQATAVRSCSTKGEGAIFQLGNRVGKSGGVEDVPTAYCAHRNAAGFAVRETGVEQTETIDVAG